MSDVLKISTPTGDAEADAIADAKALAEKKARIKQLEKSNADLEKLIAKKGGGAPAREGARKNAHYKAVSTAPSINKTPVGNSTPPLPYATFQDLSNSEAVVSSITLNGNPADVLNQTVQPSGKGDDPGTALGVKSGTVNGYVKPTGASRTVTMGGKPAVRMGDPCVMNGGNNPGIYTTTTPACANPAQSAASTGNPARTPETPQEKGWFERQWDSLKSDTARAADHPVTASLGAAEGTANQVPELGELLGKGATLQQAGKLERTAVLQALFGQDAAAQKSVEAAQMLRESADQFELPKFDLSDPDKAAGANIATKVQLATGVLGIVKSVGKLPMLLKSLCTAETVAADTAKVAKEAEGGAARAAGTAKGAKTAATKEIVSPGDGVVVKPAWMKALREKYLGRTPGKNSRTGKEVQDQMRAEGKLREVRGKTEFQASDGKWYDISKADMAHKTDAVTWWNETGRQYGAKAPEVRNWMLDSKNYTLDHCSLNRSAGAKIGQTYLPPLK